jgi:hypothetical protein
MKKSAVLFSLILVFCTVLSAQTTRSVTIDAAIKDINTQLYPVLPARGAKVAVLSFQSPTIALSNYVADQLSSALSANPARVLVSRRNILSAERESQIQITKEISDAQALALGKKVDARVVVIGYVMEFGSGYSLEMQALDVQNSKILKTQGYKLTSDSRLNDLLKGADTAPVQIQAAPAPSPATAMPASSPAPAAATNGATGSVTITNDDSEHTITMVKIYKGFRQSEPAVLITHTDPIRKTREMTWNLPEDDYYVVVFWNGNTENGPGDHIAVLKGDFYSGKAGRYDLSFRKQ